MDRAAKRLNPLLKQFADTQDNLQATVSRIYAQNGKEGRITSRGRQQVRQVKEHIRTNVMPKLSKAEVNLVDKSLKQTAVTAANLQSYILQASIKEDKEMLNELMDLVDIEFFDEVFYERIYTQYGLMERRSREILDRAEHGDLVLDRFVRLFDKLFQAKAYRSARLSFSESSRVYHGAVNVVGTRTHHKRQMFLATLDEQTTPLCQSLDGKIYDIDDEDKPDPPLHNWCRSTIFNIPYDTWEPTERMENVNKTIQDYQDYTQWVSRHGL